MIVKTLLATLVGAVVAFILGSIVHRTFGPYFQLHEIQYPGFRKENPNLPVIAVADFLLALMYAVIIYWSNMRGLMKGAIVGAVIGGLIALVFNLTSWAIDNFYKDFNVVIIRVLIYAVSSAVVSGSVGLIMGIDKKEGIKVHTF